ncbi:hypothetical protein E2P81_ATG03366 [Venturia nashicola]|nr:hypothetical protein E2P81_ATG03366 [Venturia nashicola]
MRPRSERPTPSSPADRFSSPLQRRDTKPISVDHEDRTERRSAHLWHHFDEFGRDSPPDRHQEREVRSFEDFRPADPVTRLSSSARTIESARTSSYRTPHDSIGSGIQPEEMPGAAGHNHPDLDQQPSLGSRWQDWATTVPLQADQTDSQRYGSRTLSGTGSTGHTSQGGFSVQKSVGEASNESVESYHAALQRLNSAKSSDGSGTRTSVKRWLKEQRRRPHLKLAELERERLSANSTWPSSPASASPTLNHISTFQPEDEYKHLDSRSLTSQQRSQRPDRNGRRVSDIPEIGSPSSTHQNSSPRKVHKRSLFGSLGSAFGSNPRVSPKTQPKQQDKQHDKQQDNWERRLSSHSQHQREEDSFGKTSPLIYSPTKSSGRPGRTGYFSRRPRSSEGGDDTPVKGPYVGFSRRTEMLDSPPLGGGKLNDLDTPPSEQAGWLRLPRTRINRSSSSAYSPGDTSARAMENPAAYDAWKAHLEPKANPDQQYNQTPNETARRPSSDAPIIFRDVSLDFNTPAHASTFLQTPRPVSRPPFGRLPAEGSRIPTPPTSNEPAVKEQGKYFWDSFYPPQGTDRDSTKASTRESDTTSIVSDRWHTPFPNPKDASITRAKDPETGDKDWYRIRVDQNGDNEAKDIEELKMFEWDLPEHLPNSPLCPLSPKHSSKGKGVCIYHGRKRWRDGTHTSGKYGETSPTELGIEKWI